MEKENLIAVTVSRKDERWMLPDIPWFNFVEDKKIPMLEEGGEEGPNAKLYQRFWVQNSPGPRRYIAYLSKKRNRAIELALEKYPDATDVMMCDKYYIPQIEPLRRLINDYHNVKELGVTAALGGAAWGMIRTRFSHYINRPKVEWYDKWGVPDLTFTPFGWMPEKDPILGNLLTPPIPGLFHTSSLTGISIWPRSIWDKGCRYGVFDDLHGCEHNYFFEHSGISHYTDLNAVFMRKIAYPFLKCVRISLHLGRFVPWRKPHASMPELSDYMDKYKT